MPRLMQDRALAVPTMLDGASRRFSARTVRSRDARGITEITYGDLVGRVRRLAPSLEVEISGDARVATAGGSASFADGGWTKDVIKSGGEWISSVELENATMAHEHVLEAAVVVRPDEQSSAE